MAERPRLGPRACHALWERGDGEGQPFGVRERGGPSGPGGDPVQLEAVRPYLTNGGTASLQASPSEYGWGKHAFLKAILPCGV